MNHLELINTNKNDILRKLNPVDRYRFINTYGKHDCVNKA